MVGNCVVDTVVEDVSQSDRMVWCYLRQDSDAVLSLVMEQSEDKVRAGK